MLRVIDPSYSILTTLNVSDDVLHLRVMIFEVVKQWRKNLDVTEFLTALKFPNYQLVVSFVAKTFEFSFYYLLHCVLLLSFIERWYCSKTMKIFDSRCFCGFTLNEIDKQLLLHRDKVLSLLAFERSYKKQIMFYHLCRFVLCFVSDNKK